MSSLVAAVLIMLATIYSARADDAPSDRDLQAAYCLGVAQSQMKTPEGTPEPAASVLHQRHDHFMHYLMSRGYLRLDRRADVAPAMIQGDNDWQAFYRSLPQITACMGQCLSEPRKRASDYDACQARCDTQAGMKDKDDRIKACLTTEKSLPF